MPRRTLPMSHTGITAEHERKLRRRTASIGTGSLMYNQSIFYDPDEFHLPRSFGSVLPQFDEDWVDSISPSVHLGNEGDWWEYNSGGSILYVAPGLYATTLRLSLDDMSDGDWLNLKYIGGSALDDRYYEFHSPDASLEMTASWVDMVGYAPGQTLDHSWGIRLSAESETMTGTISDIGIEVRRIAV